MPKCRKKHNKNSQIYFFLTQSVEESDTHGSEPHTHRRGPARASAPVGRSSVVGAPLGARPCARCGAGRSVVGRRCAARCSARFVRLPTVAAAPPLRAVASPSSILPSSLCLACSGLRAVASPSFLLPSSLCLACSSLGGVCAARSRVCHFLLHFVLKKK